MENTLIPVLFRNRDFIAVDKPAGLSVHNEEEKINLLLILEKQLKLAKLFPVHRLDKETSGVQILALTETAAKKISQEFESRSVKKRYLGILRGELKDKTGVWAIPLSDKGEGRKNPQGLTKLRIPCETRFSILKTSKYFTLCEFHLITGRQHQIRKHSAVSKHALVGDLRYGEVAYNKKIAYLYKNARMYLHCMNIEVQGQTILSPTPKCFEELFQAKLKK